MIEDLWQSGAETVLPVYFRPPFSVSAKIQTALTKKFIQVYLQANYDEQSFFVANPRAICDSNNDVKFRLINPSNEEMVSFYFINDNKIEHGT